MNWSGCPMACTIRHRSLAGTARGWNANAPCVAMAVLFSASGSTPSTLACTLMPGVSAAAAAGAAASPPPGLPGGGSAVCCCAAPAALAIAAALAGVRCAEQENSLRRTLVACASVGSSCARAHSNRTRYLERRCTCVPRSDASFATFCTLKVAAFSAIWMRSSDSRAPTPDESPFSMSSTSELTSELRVSSSSACAATLLAARDSAPLSLDSSAIVCESMHVSMAS